MSYRDDLEAAQARIKELENRVKDLSEKPTETEPTKRKQTNTKSSVGYAFGGLSGLVVFILLIVLGGTRACVACNSDTTDPALAALQKCPLARDLLGDDISWSVMGCANYRSRSGGDPINQGCHSSQSYDVPVSGTRGRGSFRFSTSSTPNAPARFRGGSLYAPGQYITIATDGTCTSHPY